MRSAKLRLLAVAAFAGLVAAAYIFPGGLAAAQAKKDSVLETVAAYKTWTQVHQEAKDKKVMEIDFSAPGG